MAVGLGSGWGPGGGAAAVVVGFAVGCAVAAAGGLYGAGTTTGVIEVSTAAGCGAVGAPVPAAAGPPAPPPGFEMKATSARTLAMPSTSASAARPTVFIRPERGSAVVVELIDEAVRVPARLLRVARSAAGLSVVEPGPAALSIVRRARSAEPMCSSRANGASAAASSPRFGYRRARSRSRQRRIVSSRGGGMSARNVDGGGGSSVPSFRMSSGRSAPRTGRGR